MEQNNKDLAIWLEHEAYGILKAPYNKNIERLVDELNRKWFPELAQLEERLLEKVVYRLCDDMLYEHKQEPFYLSQDKQPLNQHIGYCFSLFEHAVMRQKMDDNKTILILNIIHTQFYRLTQLPTNDNSSKNKFK